MEYHTLRRLSGIALVLAGPLCLLGGLLHPVVDGHAHDAEALLADHAAGSTALLLGEMLLVLGLPGVYAWLAPRLGVTGLVGFVLYVVGNVLSAIPHLVIMGFAGHTLAAEHPEAISDSDMILPGSAFAAEQIATGLMFMVGLLLLGIALLRSRTLPKWIGIVGIVGAAAPFLPLPVVPVLTGVQIELLRGGLVVVLGVLAIRSVSAATATGPHDATPSGSAGRPADVAPGR